MHKKFHAIRKDGTVAHHGKEEFDDAVTEDFKENEKIQNLLDDLGPTKVFPDGKLSEQDMGEIKFSVTHVEDVVILNFGTKVQWLGLTPEQARGLGQVLIRRADAADE